MKPIAGLDQLASLLQRRVATLRTDTAIPPHGQGPAAAAPHSRRSTASLEQVLRVRVRQLRQQPGAPDAVDRAVIGLMLSWEQDGRLQNEPRFNALVQRVQQHIRNDPALEQAFRRVIDQL